MPINLRAALSGLVLCSAVSAQCAFGAVGEFLYRYVLGIDTDGAGFRHIRIAPRPDGGLSEAQGGYASTSGEISSGWTLQTGRFTLKTGHTTGTIVLPSGRTYAVGSGAYRFTEAWPPPSSRTH